MARRLIEEFICDHDKQAHAVATERFAVFGDVYEIDLCGDCYRALYEAVKPFVANARKPEHEDQADAPHMHVISTGNGAVQRPVPIPGEVWWETPPNAGRKTIAEYQRWRRAMIDWWNSQDRGYQASYHGRLPREVGLAWTREVYFEQGADDE